MNTDLKPENTCTKIAPDGSLADIIALDFDPQFFTKINLTTPGLVENAQIFMLTLIIAHLGKWRNIKFTNDIMVKHLTPEKIRNMITFFVYNKLICLRIKHPLYMLYHYIIGMPTDLLRTSCVDNQTHQKIRENTNKICNYIFLRVSESGRGKTKRNKRSKRNKMSKRNKK